LSSLDLVGVALFGILAALSINGVGSKPQGNTVSAVLDFLNLNSFTIQQQAMAIGLIAAAVLVLKTVLSIYFTRRTLYFLSRRGASISSELISKVLSQPLIKINEKSSQEILFAVTAGVQAITLNVIGLSVIVVTDVALLMFMATGLLIVDPIVALSTFLIFFLTGFALFKLMHKRASKLGGANAKLNIESNQKILEILGSYRESVVKNRRSYYANEIGKSKPASLFFLSKFGCLIEKIIFYSEITKNDMCNEIDVLLTADPSLLLNKLDGKIVVKYNTNYNKHINSEYEISNLSEFKKLIEKL
jgi:ABC-type siderophore export system fused ATPase/permease subunit